MPSTTPQSEALPREGNAEEHRQREESARVLAATVMVSSFFPFAIFLPGLKHTMANLANELVHCLPGFAAFYKLLKAIETMLSKSWMRISIII